MEIMAGNKFVPYVIGCVLMFVFGSKNSMENIKKKSSKCEARLLSFFILCYFVQLQFRLHSIAKVVPFVYSLFGKMALQFELIDLQGCDYVIEIFISIENNFMTFVLTYISTHNEPVLNGFN